MSISVDSVVDSQYRYFMFHYIIIHQNMGKASPDVLFIKCKTFPSLESIQREESRRLGYFVDIAPTNWNEFKNKEDFLSFLRGNEVLITEL